MKKSRKTGQFDRSCSRKYGHLKRLKVVLIAIAFILLLLLLWPGDCSSQQKEMLDHMCEQWANGFLVGSVCSAVCDGLYYSCNPFYSDDMEVRLTMNKTHNLLSTLQPTTMKEYVSAMKPFLSTQVSTDHETIAYRLFDIADNDGDGQISVDEGVYFSYLLNDKSLFHYALFTDSEFFPIFHGTCGFGYGIQPAGQTLGSVLLERGMFSKIVPTRLSLTYPRWDQRLLLFFSLIEFYYELKEFDLGGQFHFCGSLLDDIGVDDDLNPQVIHPVAVVSKETLRRSVATRSCHSNDDCSLDSCQTKCVDGQCSTDIVRPMLVDLCPLMFKHLYNNQKMDFYVELKWLVLDCMRLPERDNRDLAENLLLIELKRLLWTNIQHYD